MAWGTLYVFGIDIGIKQEFFHQAMSYSNMLVAKKELRIRCRSKTLSFPHVYLKSLSFEILLSFEFEGDIETHQILDMSGIISRYTGDPV